MPIFRLLCLSNALFLAAACAGPRQAASAPVVVGASGDGAATWGHDGKPPPLLSWQEERELESFFRQKVVGFYFPLLTPSNASLGSDSVGQAGDSLLPSDVAATLRRRNRAVDRQMWNRGATTQRLSAVFDSLSDGPPTDVKAFVKGLPHFDDVAVRVQRVQPLTKSIFRLDFDVVMTCGDFQSVAQFRAIDVEKKGNDVRFPMAMLQNLSCPANR